jgi:hypothetical protein
MQVKGDRMALAAMQVLKGEGTEQLERVLKELEREKQEEEHRKETTERGEDLEYEEKQQQESATNAVTNDGHSEPSSTSNAESQKRKTTESTGQIYGARGL